MATSSIEAQPRGSVEFVESSVLEAVVPGSSDINFEEELGSWDGAGEDESTSILPFLSQRRVLLLDELLAVYVVFRTPLLEDALLMLYLSRLLVNVDAFAFGTAPTSEHENKPAPPKELIYSKPIPDANEPIIIPHGEGDDAYTYVIWKVDIFIARPQGRFHKPVVYFQPTASFKPAEQAKKDIPKDEYLPSRVPTALNLLQPFDNDPALAGVHPRLSAMRINKIAPGAPIVREMARPIRNGQRPIFRVLPPLIWRIRYSRVPTAASDLSLLASLDLEVAQYAAYEVMIKEISLTLHGGDAKPLTDQQDETVIHKSGDQLTYLYKIKPDLASDGTPVFGDKAHFLTLKVDASVRISPHCRPNIAIEWQTSVDFTSEQTSSLAKAAHRLSNPAAQGSMAPNPDSLPAHDTQTLQDTGTSNNAINVTLTISGPSKVRVGDVFTWDVFLVNRSEKTRKLAVLVISKRKKDVERHRLHPSTSSVGGPRVDKKDLLTTAVVDENVVYAKQKSAKTETADLVCLTTDIRLGQLSPGSCYTADLKFLALCSGVLSVEAVRVIDLATNETADIRDLPTIVATTDED